MNLSQRLRTCAKHTGLDAVIELLQEAADEIDRLSAGQPDDVTDERQAFEKWLGIRPCGAAHDLAWSAWKARALRPERVPMTERELELIDGMIAVQLDHAQRCDAISNRAMAEKQKGWDMERVELLRRIKSIGITAQSKKETP